MEKFLIYPKRILMVDHTRVIDGTVDTIAKFATDASAYVVPRRADAGVTLNIQESGIDIQERSESGSLVRIKNYRNSFGASFTINLGRWDFNIEALLRGKAKTDVEVNHKASVVADADTTVTGIDVANAMDVSEFAVIFEMPADSATGKVLRYYFPKVSRTLGDREQSMTVAQQSNQITMSALALSAAEVTAHRDIYDKVTEDGLYYPFA